MSRRLVALALALTAVACGGSTEDKRTETGLCRPMPDFVNEFGPDDGGHPAKCDALDGYELYLLDRFEVLHSSDWYFNNDRTARQSPVPDSQGVETEAIPGGRCIGAVPTERAPTLCDRPEARPGECSGTYVPDSWQAINIRTGYMTGNGGVMGTIRPKKNCISPDETKPETVCPFQAGPPEVGPCSTGEGPSPSLFGCEAAEDTSTWEGIVFWGRVGPGSESSIRIRASDPYTDDKACFCNPYTNQNDASDGCDKFGAFVELDQNYRAVFARFDEMQQGGWGLPRDHLDVSNLFEIVFEYGAGTWDLWIDDVALFRRRP